MGNARTCTSWNVHKTYRVGNVRTCTSRNVLVQHFQGGQRSYTRIMWQTNVTLSHSKLKRFWHQLKMTCWHPLITRMLPFERHRCLLRWFTAAVRDWGQSSKTNDKTINQTVCSFSVWQQRNHKQKLKISADVHTQSKETASRPDKP